MGQGISTKVAQAVSDGLGKLCGPLDLSTISFVTPTSTSSFEGCSPTWGSGTSESCVEATLEACKTLVDTLKKYKSDAAKDFASICAAAAADGAKMSSTGTHHLYNGGTYEVYAAACSVVELDVLTGEFHILSASVVYDCGESLNPLIDIGQVEGCFVQGAGCCLLEKIARSTRDNRVVSNGTWEYKVPQSLDIPVEFDVSLLSGAKNDAIHNVLGSKESGEPAMLLGIGPFFALKQAIFAARKDAGNNENFRLDCPATPSAVQQACLVALG